VVKHSRATQVNLKIEIADAALVISITDNGCGFKPAQGAPGQDGLTGIQRRMKKLGGRAELHDAGPGTRVELRLPMGEVAA
jgi:two-component system sensor histidine kinase DegS